MEQWRLRKISDEVAVEDLLGTRDGRSKSAVGLIQWRSELLRKEEHEALTGRILDKQQAACLPFHQHPKIDKWYEQYQDEAAFRFRMLLFRGSSRSGKTQKACSLFGFRNTMLVNCQGLGNHLPSLLKLDRQRHHALVLDEVSESQVLSNKAFCQAGARAVELGQSACNQFAYSIFCYRLPIILCSNKFKMSEEEGLDPEDADWLQQNVVDVGVPVSGRWWIEPDELGIEDG